MVVANLIRVVDHKPDNHLEWPYIRSYIVYIHLRGVGRGILGFSGNLLNFDHTNKARNLVRHIAA